MSELNVFNNLPDIAPDGPLDQEKGLLSVIGDPIGQVLDKVLRPLGTLTGAIGEPTGQAALDVEKQAKDEFGYEKEEEQDDSKKPGGERIGGNPQTGQNPLGL